MRPVFWPSLVAELKLKWRASYIPSTIMLFISAGFRILRDTKTIIFKIIFAIILWKKKKRESLEKEKNRLAIWLHGYIVLVRLPMSHK